MIVTIVKMISKIWFLEIIQYNNIKNLKWINNYGRTKIFKYKQVYSTYTKNI